MLYVAVYRYSYPSPEDGHPVTGARMGTMEAIERSGYERLAEDVMDVPVEHVDAEGWTDEGYWDRNMPPLYL